METNQNKRRNKFMSENQGNMKPRDDILQAAIS